MTTLWRINIKTDAEEGIDQRKFCINKNILGVGWAVDAKSRVDWQTYEALGRVKYYNKGNKGWWPALNAIKNKMQKGDLCWTRDWDGAYYLGRILSDWRYQSEPEYIAADVVNIRECNWIKIGGVDAVPGKVVNSFRAGRTIQRVNDNSSLLYSQFLYNVRSQSHAYPLDSEKVSIDLFSLIGPDDCEDIVGLFLQEEKGYRIIPSSCKKDTAKYEFILKHSDTGRTAAIQVKQGNVNLNAEDFSNLPFDDVYLFTSNGNYIGAQNKKIHYIDKVSLINFLTNKRQILSDRLDTWLSLADDLANKK